MKIRYSIGEVSKLFNIPITTLRHYHNKGIFKAGYIDKDTGYRYYFSDQFELLNNILNLRYSRLSLDKIKEHTENGDISLLKTIFLDQKEELEKTIKELECAKKSVEERLEYMEKIKKIPEFGRVLIQHMDENKIFTVDKAFYKESDLELLVRELGEKTDFSHSLTLGNVGLLMKQDSEYREYAGVYLIDKDFKDLLNFSLKPAGEYLTIYFKGKRENSPKYYKILEKYIKDNEIETEGLFYEMALVITSISSTEKQYIRRIEIKKK
ncbi:MULTISPECIES: MerR family transcriptional regulator [Psychrilyobacter]|uniref:MerR family transcriptional regulator n=1 Tax=Psychrilyobacter piezotolerans TaxID=2293438 RepID=A0ABX9KHK7_9FUSO|nr:MULTISPECIES: MerR family transcriptional regulator [Psychrilyobacter]MCS5420668.1 MerR family transcriptional regulator [Psychrilyobacter sp. S5]NDI77842.1 MerR family transcriptional regulator [Psychrilyobacter piezotolerans]RDE62304.1 MerR family transcriptional regulator [Psychrilyobacter sp. S5]REI41402.1 MerR family transcriptional regulator [Psychrilyobacter piezotolerans]